MYIDNFMKINYESVSNPIYSVYIFFVEGSLKNSIKTLNLKDLLNLHHGMPNREW